MSLKDKLRGGHFGSLVRRNTNRKGHRTQACLLSNAVKSFPDSISFNRHNDMCTTTEINKLTKG